MAQFPADDSSMENYIYKIRRVLAFGAVCIKVQRVPYPPDWRLGQSFASRPNSIGSEIRKRRLQFHVLQAERGGGCCGFSNANQPEKGMDPEPQLVDSHPIP
jgi:hypothetical protein